MYLLIEAARGGIVGFSGRIYKFSNWHLTGGIDKMIETWLIYTSWLVFYLVELSNGI